MDQQNTSHVNPSSQHNNFLFQSNINSNQSGLSFSSKPQNSQPQIQNNPINAASHPILAQKNIFSGFNPNGQPQQTMNQQNPTVGQNSGPPNSFSSAFQAQKYQGGFFGDT